MFGTGAVVAAFLMPTINRLLGHDRANIWAMKKLGVAWIISVSAVGSLQAKLKPCDVVLVDGLQGLTGRRCAARAPGRPRKGGARQLPRPAGSRAGRG